MRQIFVERPRARWSHRFSDHVSCRVSKTDKGVEHYERKFSVRHGLPDFDQTSTNLEILIAVSGAIDD
jgi:hypothetical protein